MTIKKVIYTGQGGIPMSRWENENGEKVSSPRKAPRNLITKNGEEK